MVGMGCSGGCGEPRNGEQRDGEKGLHNALSGDLFYLIAQKGCSSPLLAAPKGCDAALCEPEQVIPPCAPSSRWGTPSPSWTCQRQGGKKKKERNLRSKAGQRRGEQCGGCCVRSTSPLCLQKEVTGEGRRGAKGGCRDASEPKQETR